MKEKEKTENIDSGLMQVTKEERQQIEKQRLFKVFKQDPYSYSTTSSRLNKANQLCPSLGKGNLVGTSAELEINAIYLLALRDYMGKNQHQTKILVVRALKSYYERNPTVDPTARILSGYDVQLSYDLPIDLEQKLRKLGSEVKHPFSDLKFHILETLAEPLLGEAKKYFPEITPEFMLQQRGRNISRSFQVNLSAHGFFGVKINSQLNFQRALVAMIKMIAKKDSEYEKYLLGITKWGRIGYLGTRPLIHGDYKTFQDQVADLIGVQVTKQYIDEIFKLGIDQITGLDSDDLLERSLFEAIQHLITVESLKNHLPYDMVFFTSISAEEMQQLAREVTWKDYRLEPMTAQSYKKLVFLESIAMDTFLDLNKLEGIEKGEYIRAREKIHYIDAQEISEGLLLSPYYSETIFCPIFRIPESSVIFKQGSWNSMSFSLAKKSFEVLGLPDKDKDKSATFVFQRNLTESLIYGYAFTVNFPEDEQARRLHKMEEKTHDNFTICFITKNENINSSQVEDAEKIIFEELHRIANVIKESQDIKRVQMRLAWLKTVGQGIREDGNPAWEEGMVGNYISSLLGTDNLFEIASLGKTAVEVRKHMKNLLNRLHMSSERI